MTKLLSSKVIWLICAWAALLNIAPLLFFHLGGDIAFHRVIMDCFARQFWQGDLYPRWCMDINSGLGAPIFLFYFPLPYYIAVLLWPMTWFGADSYGVYVAGCFGATLLTALTCYAWLKDIVASRYALMGSLLFLFMPYRMEALLYRCAYAELWGMAFLPLIFKYTRRLAYGENDRENILALALSFALLLLSHVPAAAAAAAGSGMYMLVMARNQCPLWRRYIGALLWGLAVVVFYLLPALYYKQFINAQRAAPPSWPDTFLSVASMIHHGQWRMGFIMVLNLFVSGLIVLWLLIKAKKLPALLRREMEAWGAIFLAAVILLLPISRPLHQILPILHQVVLPWRMQNLFAPCLIFMLAVWMQWLASPHQRRYWKMDFLALMALLAVAGNFMMQIRADTPASLLAEQRLLTTHYVHYPIQYQSIWTRADHYSSEYMQARSASRHSAMTLIKGEGQVHLAHWAWDGIRIYSDAKEAITVRLDHNYFPLWAAVDEQCRPLRLYPEPGTGQMLLDIPAGSHAITLRYSVAQANPPLIHTSYAISLVAGLAWLVCYLNRVRYAQS